MRRRLFASACIATLLIIGCEQRSYFVAEGIHPLVSTTAASAATALLLSDGGGGPSTRVTDPELLRRVQIVATRPAQVVWPDELPLGYGEPGLKVILLDDAGRTLAQFGYLARHDVMLATGSHVVAIDAKGEALVRDLIASLPTLPPSPAVP